MKKLNQKNFSYVRRGGTYKLILKKLNVIGGRIRKGGKLLGGREGREVYLIKRRGWCGREGKRERTGGQ